MSIKLRDITTIQEVSSLYNVPVSTLKTRLELKNFEMIQDLDFKRMGKGQGTLLTPNGVKKILKSKD